MIAWVAWSKLSNNLVSTYYLCVQVDISEREKRERKICQEEHFIGAAYCIRKSAACACAVQKTQLYVLFGWLAIAFTSAQRPQ